MLYNVLAQTAGKYREIPVGEAAIYALLGFAITFMGIAFLILVVWLVGKIMGKTSGSVTKVSKPSVEEKAVVPVAKEEEITEETLAVITAALMAYYEQANVKCEFTVKRIKRI